MGTSNKRQSPNRRKNMKRTFIGLGAIAAVTAGLLVVAVAGAQEGTPSPSDAPEGETHKLYRDEFLNKLAENLGINREELEQSIDEAAVGTVDDAVANGDISEERAENIKERIEETDGFVPFFGPGPGGPHHRFFFHGDLFETAADTLGMSVEDLLAELRDGKTVAEIAAEKNVSVEDITANVLAEAKTDLDQKVADGDLTQEQADDIYARVSENIADIINGEGPLADGPRPFRGPRFFEHEEEFQAEPEEDSGTSFGA
jgi:hypothetical protein